MTRNMQIKIQSVSIEFLVSLHLSVVFPLSHLLKSVRGKTEKAKVMLYSEMILENFFIFVE